eukprot:CAMPEP_0206563084 /NCGR_PEP_ID=MMETSP0325_2-20121206/22638_1 /ASSEMBLY_ACC=CAM_ASM_000347 /TAXON_ID=2866 /ORGANISM="Crypthecodinium cohnii, Strain Seligo" /LENGTH=122 /DNA_ID=CAMNT_0054065427 /DNA_START=121 /DNA_END=486 /DNA_ORIENTATION=+
MATHFQESSSLARPPRRRPFGGGSEFRAHQPRSFMAASLQLSSSHSADAGASGSPTAHSSLSVVAASSSVPLGSPPSPLPWRYAGAAGKAQVDRMLRAGSHFDSSKGFFQSRGGGGGGGGGG